jgi:hypothetical protein
MYTNTIEKPNSGLCNKNYVVHLHLLCFVFTYDNKTNFIYRKEILFYLEVYVTYDAADH